MTSPVLNSLSKEELPCKFNQNRFRSSEDVSAGDVDAVADEGREEGGKEGKGGRKREGREGRKEKGEKGVGKRERRGEGEGRREGRKDKGEKGGGRGEEGRVE